MSGKIYCVGLGPGDPDLMSVRSHRLLTAARQIAFFRKAGRSGQARQIVEGLLPEGVSEFAMEYPVTTEIALTDPRYNEILATFYDDCADRLRALVEGGEDLVVLCEGDPFFYGSFQHLYTRLKDDTPVEIVPAITGMSGAWTASGVPMTWGDDVMTVLMGTLPEDKLTEQMASSDAIVVMKVGRNFPKVRRALERAGRLEEAWMVEYATMAKQAVSKVSEIGDRNVPYFSIVLVHGQGRRPEALGSGGADL